ncbi:FtsK/SpoIIIE domain-containing protein [Phycisphaerales bacterium AB-hyl4]|uniref:FtsK/SpoIIIE domain-containing protein n=1 Tax=Natronomicrosphaera hydrolytica TaxID=3242702 RepID=A0ABV4U6G5_9BACT
MQDRAEDLVTPFALDVRYAEEQRRALRDLLRLSAECSETQQQIAAESESVRQTAESATTRLERQLQRRHEHYREKVKNHFHDKLTRVRAEARQAIAKLKAHRVEAVNAVADEVDSSEHRTEQKLEQGQWLAESMYEAAVEQVQHEYKLTKDQVLADRKALESIEDDAEEQLQLFSLQPAEIRPAEVEDADHVKSDAADHKANPAEAYESHRKAAEEALRRLGGLMLPKLFRGVVPFAIVIVVCVGAVVLTWWFTEGRDWPATRQLLVNAGALALSAALILGLGALGRKMAVQQMLDVYRPVCENLDHAHRDLEHRLAQARALRHGKIHEADKQRKQERHKVRQRYQPILDDINQRRDKAVAKIDERVAAQRTEMESSYNEKLATIKAEGQAALDAVNARYNKYLSMARERYTSQVEHSDARTQREQASLERRWKEGLKRIEAVVQASETIEAERFPSWDDTKWDQWQPPKEQTALLRFGRLHVDMRQVASDAAKRGKYRLEVPKTFDVPALLAMPDRGSLLIETDSAGRDKSLELLQTVMARLLTTFPPGQVRFTLIDPVGLGQSFAGFMHLADYDDKLVGSRIWTESQHIEARLGALTNHMENVIQKYLRNEFKTIDEYNAQAHELAEPYRFVVIADYPHGFSEEATRRLNSIVTSGPRCGVYALVVRDVRETVPGGGKAEDLQRKCVQLVHRDGKLTWEDEVFGAFPLKVERPPHEIVLTELLNRVGEQSREASRVEVPFESIAPDEQNLWSRDASKELHVPLGRTGATRLQELRLGTGMAQHVLMAGKTGSGKSTLLHVLITNLALWYSPDEVEFYLIDFKKGVEFKTYATHKLPHARAVAIESDREFGLSVLQRLDAELARRGELFREAGVQNLADYRTAKPDAVMPRTLLIVDEFQELFSEDDKLAADASLLLDRLVRQGRAFGIHVLLGSQTLAGSSGLPRSTMGQMAVRMALQCSEADAQLIFDDGNSAAKLLSRPGEAIYNDAGGAVEGNSPFQIAWLTEAQREQQLARASAEAEAKQVEREPTIVFEGSADADVAGNRALAKLLDASEWPTLSGSSEPVGWLGEPITIKSPTSVTFARRSGANVLMVGQRDGAVSALMSSLMVSLAAQHAADAARFVVFDATPDDARWAGHFKKVAQALPHEVQIVTPRDPESAMSELADLLQQRQDDSAAAQGGPAVFVLINGLHRFRIFRRSDDDLGFSFSEDAGKGDSPDKQFATLLREGPPVGMHVVAWADTAVGLERATDRNALREFNQRVLFQMSANDSSNLIDSPIANKIGLTRALLYSEEQGTMEKFRPYALPDATWLAEVGKRLQARASHTSPGDGVGA